MDLGVLQGLTEGEVQQVLDRGRNRRFGRREVVWHEGDTADTAHFVTSGMIAVQMQTINGQVATVAVWVPGTFAGLVNGLSSRPSHATSAIALNPTETVAIKVAVLSELRLSIPSLFEAVDRMLADRTIELALHMTEAMYDEGEVRVMRRLQSLCVQLDIGEPEVLIDLTQEDIANVVGVTRPTVNRVLQKEQRKGMVKIGRGNVTILDKDAFVSSIR